jgi:hypothetical protein
MLKENTEYKLVSEVENTKPQLRTVDPQSVKEGANKFLI